MCTRFLLLSKAHSNHYSGIYIYTCMKICKNSVVSGVAHTEEASPHSHACDRVVQAATVPDTRHCLGSSREPTPWTRTGHCYVHWMSWATTGPIEACWGPSCQCSWEMVAREEDWMVRRGMKGGSTADLGSTVGCATSVSWTFPFLPSPLPEDWQVVRHRPKDPFGCLQKSSGSGYSRCRHAAAAPGHRRRACIRP